MSLVLPPPPSAEGSLWDRHGRAYLVSNRNGAAHPAWIPPHRRQSSSANRHQNVQAARDGTNGNGNPRPTTNDRGQQHRQGQNVNHTTVAGNTDPDTETRLPINPATGLPISKRAARRRRARARAAEARRQQQGSETIAQAPQVLLPPPAAGRNAGASAERNSEGNPRQPLPRTVVITRPNGLPTAPAPNEWAAVRETIHFYVPHDRLPQVAREVASGTTPAGPSRGASNPRGRVSLGEAPSTTHYAPASRNESWWSEFNAGFESDGNYNSEDDDELYASPGPRADNVEEAPNDVPSGPLGATTPCSICLDVPDEYPTISPTTNCIHEPTICAPCLTQHISHAVLSQGSTTLTCPDPECRQAMEYADVLRGARDDQICLDRYEVLLLRRILGDEPNFIWCKNATCGWGQVHDGGDDAPIVICQACHARSCFTHDVPWHTDLTCEQYTAQTESRAAEEHASEEYVQQHAKVCPNTSCGRRIEKTEGCDHMVCRPPAGCGHEFCWICFADYAPIRREGNHRHAVTCRYYAPIDAPGPSQVYRRRVEEILRARRDIEEQADHIAGTLNRPRPEPQPHPELRLRAPPPVAIAQVPRVAITVPAAPAAPVVPAVPAAPVVPIQPARRSEVGSVALPIRPPVDPEPVQIPTTSVSNSPTVAQVSSTSPGPEPPVPIPAVPTPPARPQIPRLPSLVRPVDPTPASNSAAPTPVRVEHTPPALGSPFTALSMWSAFLGIRNNRPQA